MTTVYDEDRESRRTSGSRFCSKVSGRRGEEEKAAVGFEGHDDRED